MTIDERLDRVSVELDKMQVIVAEVLDSIKRLERIAYAHMVDIDDHDERLRKLEAKLPKKPQ